MAATLAAASIDGQRTQETLAASSTAGSPLCACIGLQRVMLLWEISPTVGRFVCMREPICNSTSPLAAGPCKPL